MKRPVIAVVASTPESSEWASSFTVAAGSHVDVRVTENPLQVSPDAVMVLMDRVDSSAAEAFDPALLPATSVVAMTPFWLLSSRAVRNDPPASVSNRIFSMVPLWYADWFLMIRKTLASRAQGSVQAIRVNGGSGSGVGPVAPFDAVCEALAFVEGLAPGVPVDWREVNSGSDGIDARGVLKDTSIDVRIEIGPGASDLGAEITCESGRIQMVRVGASVRVMSLTNDVSVVIYDGPADIPSGAARRLAASAISGRRALIPLSAGLGWARSVEDLIRDVGGAFTAGSASFRPNTFSGRDVAGSEVKVFVEGRCNMSCPFCFSPDVTPPAVSIGQFGTHFRELRSQGVDSVILSGGEPTLNRDLVAIVAQARAAGITDVALETNAVLVDDRLASDLVAAGLGRVLVSLHAIDPDTAARVTGVPGLVGRTMAGIRSFLRSGADVHINFVITALNLHELPAVASWVAGESPRPGLMIISSMAAAGDAMVRPELLARVSDSAPYIREAVNILRGAGVGVVVPGQCGLPPCVLPDMPEIFFSNEKSSRDEGWSACAMPGRIHAPACAGCLARRGCYGIWKAYADRFQTDEFQPLK